MCSLSDSWGLARLVREKDEPGANSGAIRSQGQESYPVVSEANSMENKIRILVADDHALLRNGVVNVINQEMDMAVVAEAANGETAITLYHLHKPDVALIDLRMPGMGGLEASRRIKAADPNANLIILTIYDTGEDIDLCLKAGAKAYLMKDILAEDLVQCIRDVKNGKTRVAPTVAAKLAERLTQVQLTPRELDVLQLVAHGKANKEIAKELDITDGTVKVHLTNLFQKLSVTSRTEAIAAAIRRGLVRI